MLHKVFGVFSLLSFIYRYFIILPKTGSLGFTGSRFDHATMAAHMILSASSIIFRVPSFRQARRPTMIWHEYRLHAILFTGRCCLVYLLALHAPHAGAGVRFCTTMIAHVFVDYVTSKHGSEGETTIRGKGNTKNDFITRMRRGYSFYQFLALGSHLTASPRAMDMGYNTIIAIQSSAFMMTLNRKGLATWQTHFKVYTLALLLSAGYIVGAFAYDYGIGFGALFVAAILGSFQIRRLGVSKYLIWASFAGAMACALNGMDALSPHALIAIRR